MALGVPRGGSGNAPVGGWRDAEGVDSTCMERGVEYWPLKIPFGPFLLCLYDVIIIFNTSDLILLTTPIPFRKCISFHGFALCTNIPVTEDQPNLISLMPLLGLQIIP